MEWALLIIVLVFFVFVAPLWSLIRTARLKRDSATREEVSSLVQRIFALEKQVKELWQTLETAAPAAPKAVPAEPPAVRAAPPPPAEVEKPAAILAPPRFVPKPAPTPKVAPPTPAPRRWADLEERLGTNWLNKIGTAVLVIGTAFFLNYSIRQLGPAGKIAVGYALAAALLTLGVLGERRERYRVLARAVLGGGWALMYFTTYAMHNVPAVQIVKSAGWGFALLFVVAAAMVGHSLRYNSGVVTGLAYMLGFASVAVSRIQTTTLVASAVLATSLVIVLWRRHWYRLEPVAIVATYAVHWMWLTQIRDWYGAHKPFPEFNASVALCSFYWVLFAVSFFLRDERESRNRNLLVASFLLNAAGYLAVLRYQSIHPEWRFWFLLVTGMVYLAIAGAARWRDRRLGFLLHSTLGAALLLVAIPYRYSGARLELLWLVEAEALLFVGWRTAEAHLRKLGWAAAGVLATYVLFHDLSPRLVTWRLPDWPLGWLLIALAAAYYADARLTERRLGQQATETERNAAKLSTPIATGFLMAAAWVALPYMWTGLVWAALAVILGEVGRRTSDAVLRGCGHAAAALAAIRLLAVNLEYAPPAWGTNLRVLTMGLAAALFYLVSRRVAAETEAAGEPTGLLAAALRPGRLPAAYTWAATTLVFLLLWNEVTNAAVGLAWALVGVVLGEVGRARRDAPLLVQGYTLLVLSFARIFFADLNAGGPLGPFTERLASVSVLAAMYYYSAFAAESAPRWRTAYTWFGTTALVALLRFELPLAWIAVGWAVLTLALFWAGRRLALNHLRYQAYLLTLFVALRCAFDNFYQAAPLWGALNERTVTVTIASLLLYVLLITSLVRKGRQTIPAETGHD